MKAYSEYTNTIISILYLLLVPHIKCTPNYDSHLLQEKKSKYRVINNYLKVKS